MLHNFDAHHFLKNYWQKSPLLIKAALTHPPDFVSADELAGLALEQDVESRIISNYHENWQIQHGPFEESVFSELSESHWTLLIQSADYWLPEIAPWLNQFRFVPRWRFDDVMISYATAGGGVGPHFDNYDVFLVQTEGERRWRVGAKGDTGAQQTKINGLLHLENFEPVIDAIMQPGDILYIPPDTPHWGESIGESIGYSVGYRSPQTKELLAALANHFESSDKNIFFEDIYREKPNQSSQLESELIEWAQTQLRNIADNQQLITSILSEVLSHPKIDSIADTHEIHLNIKELASIKLIDGVNYNWYQNEESIFLSIEGESFEFPSLTLSHIKPLLDGESLDIQGLELINKEFAIYQTLARILERGYFSYNS